jgi:carbonic anhydrase
MLAGAAALAATLSRDNPAMAAMADHPPAQGRISGDEALRRMVRGNRRFTGGEVLHPRRTPADFKPLAHGQSPIAAVVSCADSRVAPEILFDQGIGDLFVIRVAGNYVDGAGAAVKGSVEYAVAELNVALILVLGHTQCGAVKAAIKHIHDHDALPGAINDLVNAIKPAVLETQDQPGDPLENATEANVRRGVEKLKQLGPVVAPAVQAGRLKIAGGVYDLASGRVTILSA